MTQPILTDSEIMEMLVAFYAEALRFLDVPSEQWADVKTGAVFDGTDGKLSIISINYAKRKIIVCLPALKMMLLTSPNATGDSPSVYRSCGYKLARLWQQYLKTGQQRIFNQDEDSYVFAEALGIIKGLPLIDAPVDGNLVKTIGFNPFDREAAISMLRDEFGIDCCVKHGYDLSNKTERSFVALTDQECLRRGSELMALREECNKRPLPKRNEGELGSKSNPFANVDEAADYILTIEKERLDTDVYRQAIKKEQYYYDFEHGFFRIPWASANVGYYPIEGSAYPCFIVNQLSQRVSHFNEMPRFSIKPSLANNKFLFRGQSEFFDPCVPNMFRDKTKVAAHQFVDDVIQINELEVLLRQHPLVKLFEQGFYLLHEFFRFKVDYMGLSQHYYNRTPLLDLTCDMEVAKFFAVTWFNMGKDCYEKYTGNNLGVLYYYDLAADAFTYHKGRDYMVETIGKQPFMRSGNQAGFLIRLGTDKNFNELPEVRYVFFQHDQNITDRIFDEAEKGDKYMPQEMLRSHWYKRMNDAKAKMEISEEALKLNFENNKDVSHRSIVKDLQSKGFHISKKNRQYFTEEELDTYYAGALEFWADFCSNVHIYSPEGTLLHKHLMNLPNDPRYRWAFCRDNSCEHHC